MSSASASSDGPEMCHDNYVNAFKSGEDADRWEGGREGVSRPLMQKAKLLPDSAKGRGVCGKGRGREGGRSQCQQVTEIT